MIGPFVVGICAIPRNSHQVRLCGASGTSIRVEPHSSIRRDGGCSSSRAIIQTGRFSHFVASSIGVIKHNQSIIIFTRIVIRVIIERAGKRIIHPRSGRRHPTSGQRTTASPNFHLIKSGVFNDFCCTSENDCFAVMNRLEDGTPCSRGIYITRGRSRHPSMEEFDSVILACSNGCSILRKNCGIVLRFSQFSRRCF